ncbi:MAG: photosynthetic reaction center subunit H [Rhodopila sp.]
MRALADKLAQPWTLISTRFLPFADAATPELPLGRLLRLSLFQVSVGLAVVLLIGTLNRVMIVELLVPTWLVAVMISLPLVFAPFRAVIGFRSDNHRSVLGWRRVPYIWFGTLLQFGGLAIMPFALIVLSGDTNGPLIYGDIGAALSFLLVGASLHTTQTVGLALATDLAPEESHPRVVALLCMMLLLGMIGGALAYGFALRNFTEVKLIQVIQATALATMVLNVIALWKQEPRNPALTSKDRERDTFAEAWTSFRDQPYAKRKLVALGLGTIAFSMQDVLLEPYGGQVLHLTVGSTTLLSALLATGGLTGFGIAARKLGRGADPYRLAALGALIGLVAFTAVIFAAPLESQPLFAVGTVLIGFSAGLFAHCTLTAAMGSARKGHVGLALGVWGAVQASAAGSAVAAGGLIRDGVGYLAMQGRLGEAMTDPAIGYSVVYHIEIALLFATLIAIGPLVRRVTYGGATRPSPAFGVGEIPLIRSAFRGDVMEKGAITSYIDVAQVTLYVFWAFFFGLVYYLRKEDKREGYPLIGENGERPVGFPIPPKPKRFLLPHGGESYAPRAEDPQPTFTARSADVGFGAPLVPATANPMASGVGPSAYALRRDEPDMVTVNQEIRIVPLRNMVELGYVVDDEGPDPRGMSVVGCDGVVAGTVADIWFNKSEDLVRYLQVDLNGGGTVMIPAPLTRIIGDTVNMASVLGSQIADAPKTASLDQITLREEDKIQAYFASGHLFATPGRSEPMI